MTTLYRPVLIETAEQAEALPAGAMVPVEDKDGPWEKRPDGAFQGAGRVLVEADRVLDRIALVPVEAEEEFFMTHDGRPFGLPMDEAAARTDAARNAHRGAGVAHRFVTLEEPA